MFWTFLFQDIALCPITIVANNAPQEKLHCSIGVLAAICEIPTSLNYEKYHSIWNLEGCHKKLRPWKLSLIEIKKKKDLHCPQFVSHNVHTSETFVFSGLLLSCPVDTRLTLISTTLWWLCLSISILPIKKNHKFHDSIKSAYPINSLKVDVFFSIKFEILAC